MIGLQSTFLFVSLFLSSVFVTKRLCHTRVGVYVIIYRTFGFRSEKEEKESTVYKMQLKQKAGLDDYATMSFCRTAFPAVYVQS